MQQFEPVTEQVRFQQFGNSNDKVIAIGKHQFLFIIVGMTVIIITCYHLIKIKNENDRTQMSKEQKVL